MITIKSNQYKLLIYIITVCHLLAGCSDDLFGGDESRGSGNRITLSGEILLPLLYRYFCFSFLRVCKISKKAWESTNDLAKI